MTRPLSTARLSYIRKVAEATTDPEAAMALRDCMFEIERQRDHLRVCSDIMGPLNETAKKAIELSKKIALLENELRVANAKLKKAGVEK